MRNVRIFYKKKGAMKFVSHLDMNRFMARLISKSKIPVWYTEGFNQHIYMNFAVPLSLGFEGLYEILDMKIVDDAFSDEDCLNALKSVATKDIEFFEVAEPRLNMKEIGFAEFELQFDELDSEKLNAFLSQNQILCEKKGKKGKVKEIDLIPKIKEYSITENKLKICLVAGSEDNLNPSLVIATYFEQTDTVSCFYSVSRTSILTKDGKLFK